LVARFTDWFAAQPERLRAVTVADAASVILFAVLALLAAVGLVLLGLWMLQRGDGAYLPLLLVFLVVPVVVWHVR
jgi:hypothetical protein